jgi:transglutaminase-like putative cysteine protease
MKAFAYAGGHSTVAADTWRLRRGDCLSLSVMSVALARALAVPAQVQEVRVPASFDRRGGVDFLNAHVNVLVRNDRPLRTMNRALAAGDG